MPPHRDGCARALWLATVPRGAYLRVVVLREGPACTCPSPSTATPYASEAS